VKSGKGSCDNLPKKTGRGRWKEEGTKGKRKEPKQIVEGGKDYLGCPRYSKTKGETIGRGKKVFVAVRWGGFRTVVEKKEVGFQAPCVPGVKKKKKTFEGNEWSARGGPRGQEGGRVKEGR